MSSFNYIIPKIVGIGSAGCNAVERIYSGGKADDSASFLIIDTDLRSLKNNAVPEKLHISVRRSYSGNPVEVTEAQEDAIREALSDGTQMVFIIAGMGGHTGTGIAPVVARIAKELGIVPVGFVTIPFAFEGPDRIEKASVGVEKMLQLAAVFTVNNDQLVKIYPDVNFIDSMSTSNEVLAATVENIIDIWLASSFIVNIDVNDVSWAFRHAGRAVLVSGTARGKDRIARAIDAACSSSTSQDDIAGAKTVILQLCFSKESPVQMQELVAIRDFMTTFPPEVKALWCASEDVSLGEDVKIVIMAVGIGHDAPKDGQAQD